MSYIYRFLSALFRTAFSSSADHIEADRIDSDQIDADQIDTDQLEADRVKADNVETNHIETTHINANHVETDHFEAEHVETDRIEANYVEASIYEFAPLDLDIKQIRLVHVQPRIPGAPISCLFDTALLSAVTEYAALSYTWGLPTSTRSILLNGKPFLVRENLWNFLDQMEEYEEPLPLWIDAISIDQNSDFERNHQVAMMGEIYSKAAKVMVWLGPGTEEIKKHMMLLWELSVTNTTHVPRKLGRSELLRLRYWSRLWILQEFVLAASIQICCGDQRLDGSAMMWLADSIDGSGFLIRSQAMRVIRKRKHWIKSSRDESRGIPILDLLETSAYFECSDPRDLVYGMIGLAARKEVMGVKLYPDYSKPASQVFQELELNAKSYFARGSYVLARLVDTVSSLERRANVRPC
jgi:hypothetical protein